MKDFSRSQERYLKDPLPKRLGALAANLARVASAAPNPANARAIATLLEESRRFVEWTAAEMETHHAAEMVDFQLAMTLWLSLWSDAQSRPGARALLSLSAAYWSDRVLTLSRSVNPAPASADDAP